jgi:hypothetical protein
LRVAVERSDSCDRRADPDALDADHLTARGPAPIAAPENAKARDEAERLLGE